LLVDLRTFVGEWETCEPSPNVRDVFKCLPNAVSIDYEQKTELRETRVLGGRWPPPRRMPSLHFITKFRRFKATFGGWQTLRTLTVRAFVQSPSDFSPSRTVNVCDQILYPETSAALCCRTSDDTSIIL